MKKPTAKTLNWGLLSTARINRALIPVLKSSKRNRLVAVASRSQDSADAFARKWKIRSALGSYEALIQDPEIDVIYIPLPNSLHAEWTIKALLAGKHVLCEKPLGMTLSEVDAMEQAALKGGAVLTEAFMYRHHPQTLRVKELVDGGDLGKLQLIKGSYTYTMTGENNIRSVKELGGGSLWDVGCYPVSYARMIAGAEPLEAFGWHIPGSSGIDMTFVGQLRFPDEIYAQIDCSFNSPPHAFIEIIGSEGALNIPMPFKPGRREKIFLTRSSKTETIEVKGGELYIGEVEDLADAVLLGKSPHIPLSDSRGNTAAILALLESAGSGQPVLI